MVIKSVIFSMPQQNTTTTATILPPFVLDYPGELVPEETFTHSHLS